MLLLHPPLNVVQRRSTRQIHVKKKYLCASHSFWPVILVQVMLFRDNVPLVSVVLFKCGALCLGVSRHPKMRTILSVQTESAMTHQPKGRPVVRMLEVGLQCPDLNILDRPRELHHAGLSASPQR